MTVIAFPTELELKIQHAVEAGLLPEDRVIPDELAVLLIKSEVPEADQPAFQVFNGTYKNSEEKMGRLNRRVRPIALGRTTLTWYGEVVAEVKVWPTPEDAQKFFNYENGFTVRTEPRLNEDAATAEMELVVWEEIDRPRDKNWKTEVI